jgi:AbrB family looped-hinge helix DNA binding protein
MVNVKQTEGGAFMQTTVRLSSKNQIVLPREAREAMHLKGRDELLVVVKDDVTIIMPKPESYRAALSGMGKGIYPKAHLRKERRSW